MPRWSAIVFCLTLPAGALLPACSSPVAPDLPVDATVVLAPGQPSRIAPLLVLTFVRVASDSRCPADAVCIVPGEATVVLRAANDTLPAREWVLRTTEPGRTVIVDGGTAVTLVQLAPYPLLAEPIDPADYRATLRVVRP